MMAHNRLLPDTLGISDIKLTANSTIEIDSTAYVTSSGFSKPTSHHGFAPPSSISTSVINIAPRGEDPTREMMALTEHTTDKKPRAKSSKAIIKKRKKNKIARKSRKANSK